ncbi:MAG: polysaccharide deacetylase family protein [Thermoproteota archaeon]
MIKLVFLVLAGCFIAALPAAFAQQNTGTLDVFIKNENNDRIFPQGVLVKIYKDLEKTPTQEILSLENNPFSVSSLPLGHRYKVEVYVNNMYASVGFIDLQQSKQNLEITIKNFGGMRLNVFYKDGQTPLSGAYVVIKSHDGKSWHTSSTDQFGNSIRAWLYPSIKDGDYYYAEISLGPGLKFTSLPIKLQPSVAQEFKVITPWPTIIDKLITVEVYNSTKTKVTKQDGVFVAQLFDSKKNKVAESPVSDKGLAYFSKLKVNSYALYIKSKDDTGNLHTIVGKKAVITEATNTIKVYLHNPELNSDHLDCNCVAFRLDDIQDFYLAPAQLAVISLFEQKDLPITIGVIGGVIGTDQKLISTIKAGLASENPIEIASHSWNNKILSSMTKKDQEELIVKTNDKIMSVFGVKPKTFIPPENVFNNETLSVLKNNGFTHISYDATEVDPPPFKKSDFYHFPILPSTADLDANTGIWRPLSNDTIMDKIEQSLFDYGYAVVMMHPYEFSLYENGFYVNKVNTTKVKELESLIETIQSKNLRILPIGSIENYDMVQNVTTNQEDVTANCNCLAFRLDNVQDFWLNDVQNALLDTLDKKDVPITISVIGKFIGDDPKVVEKIKEKLKDPSQARIANRGWEHIDHTSYDEEKQAASIRQTNEKIRKVFGVSSVIFVPPYDTFNEDTLKAARQNKVVYFSANIAQEKLPFRPDLPRHIPSTVSFANLVDDDPFLSGTIQQKALQKVRLSLTQYGFAVVSMQPSDFAVKTDVFENEVSAEKLALLEALIDDARASGINIVLLQSVPAMLDESKIIIPDWIKSNAKWWAEDKIGDVDFTKGLEYLIEQKIIQIPTTQQGEGTERKIPSWIKSNAKWWAEDKIGNSDFVKGIQYLIQNGIIRI